MAKLIERKIEKLGLTYDDILLRAEYSEMDPAKVNVASNLTKKIKLKIPILSAAMDTVTEAKLAIALALDGGLGIIHKNYSAERQAEEVALVKRFESGFVEKPLTLSPANTLRDAREINKKYSGIPITKDGSSNGRLVGLLTSKDYYFDDPDTDTIDKYMTTFDDLVIDYEGITLEQANQRLKESKKGKVLIIDNDKDRRLMSIVCRRDLEKNYDYPNSCKDENKRLRVGAAVGVRDYKDRAGLLIKAGVDVIVVDTAHGHSKNVIDAIKDLKKNFDINIIGGNVATKDGTEALIEAGADAVKVGIGPGAICTTRIVTGVGSPQASAVLECVEAAGDIPIIADGGIKYSGDIAKAIGLGANAVMIGGLFAGTNEAPGETVITEDHRVYKSYRGMGSIGAMMDGSADRYFQTIPGEPNVKKLVAEGIEGMVPAIGPLADHLYQLIGGLKQAMGYCGAKTIDEFQKKATFIQAMPGTASHESHPRVDILKDAPNYPRRT
ncbi:MAG: IMP dehydrogenase [Thermoplasmata archaeon]|nr:MAG: IMP dehydrogenase [Thermoplasmata archaeon]